MTTNTIPIYYNQIRYVQRIRCIKIVLKTEIITNCISQLRMARRGLNM
jgi:hypothetical protein